MSPSMSQEEISNPSASQTKPKFPFFSDNEEYWFETLRALGSSSYGAVRQGAERSPSTKWAADQAGFVMGEPTPHAVVAKILKFHLRDGIAEQIS